MPIINGTYQPETLGSARAAQQQVFGDYSRGDMSDYSSSAYNYLMKQQEQAYNLELWNLQNQYNSPAAQMQRYQDAGLNPNLIYQQQNLSSSPSAASAPSFRSAGTFARSMQNAVNMIGQFRSIVQDAFETYKYFSPYGHVMRSFDQELGGLRVSREQAEADWLRYITYGADALDSLISPEKIPSSKRAGMYNLEAHLTEQNYLRVKALANMIPDQKARTQALQALDEKRLDIMKGQNDAVLNIHTGNETVDSWLKALMYFAMSKL